MRRIMKELVVLVSVVFSFLGISSVSALSSHPSHTSAPFYEVNKKSPLYLQLGSTTTSQDQQNKQYAEHYSHASHGSHGSHYSHYSSR